MKRFKIFNLNKILIINLILTIYFLINALTGDKGYFSMKKKDKMLHDLTVSEGVLLDNLESVSLRNDMLTEDLNLDYLDEKYREIFVLGKKNEVLYIINDKQN
ncbi:MAG: septation ring formation regulator EzrA [Candidatus Pelagibacter sp.]|nr:septation ring formation regulator EzrA [Candidatus Pelagibacter sp.]OUW11660.1 MAG: hypothetical protein CBD26_01025 [Candidatus Pelagibacter sp. TMED166]|tara:strand:- start:21498 stop:21806 length:309 start_codon:yes stop_codon:yes gene_type:complete